MGVLASPMSSARPRVWVLLLLLLAPAASVHAQEREDVSSERLARGIDDALARGVDYLLATQQRDGSWANFAEGFAGGQTALSLTALLHAGLDPGHPAIQRGFAALEQTDPQRTYALSCQLIALGMHDARRHRGRMEELLERLLSWQEDGLWGYPNPDGAAPGSPYAMGRPDLSNTQFATLALRAAERAGLDVPARVWKSLARGVLRMTFDTPLAEGGSVPGFRYRLPRPKERDDPSARGFEVRATGSTTAAGVAILHLAREALGGKVDASVERAIEDGLRWIDLHFDATANPKGGPWVEAYLYGLERVGALLNRPRLGGRDWYREGAITLLERQTANGAWISLGPESSTSFAILFLTRASAPLSGGGKLRPKLHVARGEVHLRATGEDPLSMWITGFDPALVQRHGPLEILEATYLLDGEPVARIEAKDASDERFAHVHDFTEAATYALSVVVRATPREAGDGPRPKLVLASDEVQVDVRAVVAPWMLDRARVRDLLREAEVEAEASSEQEGFEAARGADGYEHTRWLYGKDDPAPTFTLRLGRGTKARRLLIGGAETRRLDAGRFDRLARAHVVVDGRHEYEVSFDPDPRVPAEVVFRRPRAVRKVEIRLERVPGTRGTDGGGLSEVLLLEDAR